MTEMSHHSIYKPHKSIRLVTLAVWIFISFFVQPSQVLAASGMPDSTEFGYGARLDLWGQEIDLSINAAAAIGLDWIGIEFDWARHWPDPQSSADLEILDGVMVKVKHHQINVLLSISNPPAWATTPVGPDVQRTIDLITLLVDRYPDDLLTIELFPAANTFKGWGAPPDPISYSVLLNAAQIALKSSHSSAIIIAAGLTPLSPGHSPVDMDDIVYLSALYEAGAAAFMPIVSVRLNELDGDTMTPPDGNDPRVLRHYETVRQVMLKYNHTNGLIWITDFTWPSSKVETSEQTRWLIQAFPIMKSQLYLGVAFFDRLNPPDKPISMASHSLIQKYDLNTHLHPAMGTLGQIITVGRTGQATSLSMYLYKKMVAGPNKSYLKTNLQ